MANSTCVIWLKGLVWSAGDSKNTIEDQDYTAGDNFLVFKTNEGEVIEGQLEGYGHHQGRS